ncbi:hypothetical protein PG993_000893 [Apiospora rasikravindrae]|uniref:Uncharacterized protein n=1 Tax=Apiospora rasikravindrae TaxID=990691 RepID=A0ABR1U9W0_9PEZI
MARVGLTLSPPTALKSTFGRGLRNLKERFELQFRQFGPCEEVPDAAPTSQPGSSRQGFVAG